MLGSLEINAAIAQHVLGMEVQWVGFSTLGDGFTSVPMTTNQPGCSFDRYVPNFVKRTDLAVDLVAKAMYLRHDFEFDLKLPKNGEVTWYGGFGKHGVGFVYGRSPCPAEAICLGALMALGIII